MRRRFQPTFFSIRRVNQESELYLGVLTHREKKKVNNNKNKCFVLCFQITDAELKTQNEENLTNPTNSNKEN